MSQIIVIDKAAASLKAIYSDSLLEYIEQVVLALGLPRSAIQIQRATHVEPDPAQREGGNWFVDFSPVGGPLSFRDEEGRPFITRESALQYERRWLLQNWLREPVERNRDDVSSVT